MKTYTPKPYAARVHAHFDEYPRCALWAAPGMGKTVLVLDYLNTLYNVRKTETAPTLILGTKRVAQTVWGREATKWAHLKALKVITLVGTGDTIRATLKKLPKNTHAVVVNYEALPTVVDYYESNGLPFPFAAVVADESSKLKGFRTRQGSVRIGRLRPHAHTAVNRWINLTGTPASNGLQDLWGQMWFIDQGKRLGPSYTRFEERFFTFRQYGGHAFARERTILPGADTEIHNLVSDVCLTLRPQDWFDIDQPRVNVVEVELPLLARTIYRKVERDFFAELESGCEVEAVNAAVKSAKCLQMASGTVYLEDGKTEVLHRAKIEALQDLLDECYGPVLVAYHFKSDLAHLKEHFKDALDLSTDAGLTDALKGRGKVWLANPASFAHGVDGLQNHCHTVAFFGLIWSLENHDQFIERVGPMRQKQACTGRQTEVHYIVARKTVDEVVMARLRDKASVQQALLNYRKHLD
ncbi:MAG: SNF2-related protein [Shewanella sp.]